MENTEQTQVPVSDDYEFYQSVSKTNPLYVKNQKAGGRTISTIDPQSQTEAATEKWGLYGKAWGIKDITFTTRKYNTTEVMTLSGIFWFPDGEFPYSVSDKSFYVSSKGNDIIDIDIEKKLLTSFKSKCLSLLGFNSDIFLGKFDDANYVNEMWGEFTMISPEQRVELSKMISDTDTDLGKFNEAFGIANLAEMPVGSYQKAKAMLQAKLNKAK